MTPARALAGFLILAWSSASAGSLWVSKKFVETHKNRALITTQFQVDKTLSRPHPAIKGGDDGDIHAAGRDNTIRLPLVVELTNAKAQPAAMKAIANAVGQAAIPLTGVWRLWFEHAGTKDQVQGQAIPVLTTTNPDHVFEIHPITSVGGVDTLASFKPIPGYTAYEAERAFTAYQKIKCQIAVSGTAINIITPNAGFNHAQFTIQRRAKWSKGADNQTVFVLVDVFGFDNAEERVNVNPVRLVAVEGTSAAQAIKNLGASDRMKVLAIPRVNLGEVSAIAATLKGTKTFSGPLPFEMIVVAPLPD